MDPTGIRSKVEHVLSTPAADISVHDINDLLVLLAEHKETDALVRVWDTIPKKDLARVVTDQTWSAIEKLHSLGKGKIPNGTIIMPSDGAGAARRLPAPRRLHKIIKGRIIHNRSELAKAHLPAAMAFAATHPELTAQHRSVQVKRIKAELKISNDTARGLVTKLKQKKLL